MKVIYFVMDRFQLVYIRPARTTIHDIRGLPFCKREKSFQVYRAQHSFTRLITKRSLFYRNNDFDAFQRKFEYPGY